MTSEQEEEFHLEVENCEGPSFNLVLKLVLSFEEFDSFTGN